MARIGRFVDAINRLRANLRREWWIEGWDTFAGHCYPLPGQWRSEKAAVAAARRRLRALEESQPSETSGGQDGIQDQVFVRGPGGVFFRVRD